MAATILCFVHYNFNTGINSIVIQFSQSICQLFKMHFSIKCLHSISSRLLVHGYFSRGEKHSNDLGIKALHLSFLQMYLSHHYPLFVYLQCLYFLVFCNFKPHSRFVTLANKDQNQTGRTKLDRERLKSCMRELVSPQSTTSLLCKSLVIQM